MDTTFTKALELFVNKLSKQGKSSNTIVAYKGDINQMIAFLLGRQKSDDVTAVKSEDLEALKKDLQDKNYTAKSISRKLNSIKNLFSFLKQEGVISEDPSEKVKHPKYENEAPRILRPIEYRALRDACRQDTRITAIVELMLQGGLRIKEIENLELEDVKDGDVIIKAYESHQERRVPLNNSAKTALKKYIDNGRADNGKSKRVFITKTGRPLLARNIRNLLNRYFTKSDIQNVKVNDLRNTFIAFQLKSGVPLDVVSKVSGHKRISTTEKYLEFLDGKEEGKGIKLKEL